MGLTYGLIALAAVLGAFTIALFSRVRALATANEALRKDYDGAREQIRELAEKERKASAKLDERTDEVQSLKKEVGAQKKKAFATTEELKALKAELKAAKDAAQKAAHARPAFADEPKKTPAPVETKTPAASVPDRSGEIATLEERVSGLEDEKKALAKKIAEAETELKRAKGELRRTRRRVDEYRRADQVARSRSELSDDKVRYLSRQYYEAVSELAALKGEVAPAPPREIDELRRSAAEVERAPVRATVSGDRKDSPGLVESDEMEAGAPRDEAAVEPDATPTTEAAETDEPAEEVTSA